MQWRAPVDPWRSKPAIAGFTLLELMIALVVMAVLAAIALPSYVEYVRKGRRSDAVSRLTQLQQSQERRRANNPSYTTALEDLQMAASANGSYYTLAIADATASSYTATATAIDGSPQASDAACQVFTLTINGGSITYSSTNHGGAVNTANPNPCWNR